MPADDQDTVLPWVSVMVTMVLLKVAATWATPTTTFFFSFLRARGPPFAAGFCASAIYLVTFFLPAIALAEPLRVRALVWVRWPRTGKPFLWRRPRQQARSISRLMFIAVSRRRSPSTVKSLS